MFITFKNFRLFLFLLSLLTNIKIIPKENIQRTSIIRLTLLNLASGIGNGNVKVIFPILRVVHKTKYLLEKNI